MTKFIHKNGLEISPHIQKAYDKAICALTENELSHGLNLERLALKSHTKLYSIRLSIEHRLLLTLHTYEEQPVWIELDCIEYHHYDKSPFLKQGVLDRYLKTLHIDVPPLDDEDFDPQIQLIEEFTFFNKTVIQLSDPQKMATTTTFPLLINGAPGSGKSCVALSILEQLADSIDEHSNILYVTQNDRLTKRLKIMWDNLPISEAVLGHIHFCSYDELLKQLHPIAGLQLLQDDAIHQWFSGYVKRYKQRLGIQAGDLSTMITDHQLAIEEFRIISGCSSLDQYQGIGTKNNNVHSCAQKDWLWEAYQTFNRTFINESQIYSPLFPFKTQQRFTQIVVDEAHDFSPLQIHNLVSITNKKQICFLYDGNQRLFDSTSLLPFLLAIPNITQFTLPHSYRCPDKAVRLSNKLLDIKYLITGGLLHKCDAYQIKNNPNSSVLNGNIYRIKETTSPFAEQILHEQGSPDFAVVTDNELINEAIHVFKTPLVFTAAQIKGLEYRTIVCYNPFHQPVFKEANKKLSSLNVTSEMSFSFFRKKKSENGHAADLFSLAFNHLYTAFTRTTNTLIIHQQDSQQYACLDQILFADIESMGVEQKPPPKISSERSIDERWTGQIEQLRSTGNTEVADRVTQYLSTKKKTPIAPLAVEALSCTEAEPAIPTQVTIESVESTLQVVITPTNTCVSPLNQFKSLISGNLIAKAKQFVIEHLNSSSIATTFFTENSLNSKDLTLFQTIYNTDIIREYFSELIKKSDVNTLRKLAKGINPDEVTQKQKNRFNDIASLMLQTEQGMSTLLAILYQSEHLSAYLDDNFFNQPLILPDATIASIFFGLTALDQGIKFLHWALIETYPEALLPYITPTRFFNGKSVDASFFMLSQSHYGRIFIDALFHKRPDLIQFITVENFYFNYQFPISQGIKARANIFLYYLNYDADLLIPLFAQHKELITSLTKRDLIESLPPEDRDTPCYSEPTEKYHSFLYSLTSKATSQDIFHILLEGNPALYQQFTWGELSSLIPNHSIIKELVCTSIGVKILRRFIENNTVFLADVTWVELISSCTAVIQAQQQRSNVTLEPLSNRARKKQCQLKLDKNTSLRVIDLLSQSLDGHFILNAIKETSPILSRLIQNNSPELSTNTQPTMAR